MGTPRTVGPAVRRSLPAYGPTDGHQVIELPVGWPTRKLWGVAPPIKHVAIKRFFHVDGRVAASEDYERTSGAAERVDTDAPELTDDNRSVLDAETTLAFVSDDGAS